MPKRPRKVQRRPNVKRPRRMRRVPRSIKSHTLSCVRKFWFQNWTFGNAAVGDYWRYYQFQLGNLPNLVEMTGLFDEYKINAIKITFRPAYDSVASDASALNVSTAPQAYLHYDIDPGNTVLPSGLYNSATLNSFMEHAGVKTRTLNRPVSIYLRPKILVDGNLVRKSGWIRTTDTSTNYRGVHVFLQQNNFSTSNTRISLDVFYTFYMQFKNLR